MSKIRLPVALTLHCTVPASEPTFLLLLWWTISS